MRAGEVVLKLSLRPGDEADAFSQFLFRFLAACNEAVERLVSADPPVVIVTSEPGLGADLRTVVFQESALAAAFSRGWEQARGGAGRALRRL